MESSRALTEVTLFDGENAGDQIDFRFFFFEMSEMIPLGVQDIPVFFCFW